MIWITVLLLCLIPELALAWGPGAHLEFAGAAFSALAPLPIAVKHLLHQFKYDYYYGSLAPDITLGKDLHGYYYNCHNWSVALRIFHEHTQNDAQRAFMLGYLGHLAADTVSHNFFVPFKMIRSWKRRVYNHVYWEVIMDDSVPEKYRSLLDQMTRVNFREHDALLETHLKPTFLSFKASKRLFNSLLTIQGAKRYQRWRARLAGRQQGQIERADILVYKRLCKQAVWNILRYQDKSHVLEADPTGKLKMLYAKELVTQLRQAVKNRKITPMAQEQLIRDLKLQLRGCLYSQGMLPHIETYLS